MTYEVEYRKDGQDHETYFAEDGTIVSKVVHVQPSRRTPSRAWSDPGR